MRPPFKKCIRVMAIRYYRCMRSRMIRTVSRLWLLRSPATVLPALARGDGPICQVRPVGMPYTDNFIKNGDPNGPGLPKWPANYKGKEVWVQHINDDTRAEPEQHRDRYEYME